MDNKRPFDRYTLGHGAFGFMLGLGSTPWYVALGGSIVWELLENYILKPTMPSVFPVGTPDTFANATVDTVAWMAGWGLGRAIPRPPEEIPAIWR